MTIADSSSTIRASGARPARPFNYDDSIASLLSLPWARFWPAFSARSPDWAAACVIVPLLTLVFGVDIRYAIGASLVSVIATSSGAAAAYVNEGYSNIRIGMFLEIATTIGALVGA